MISPAADGRARSATPLHIHKENGLLRWQKDGVEEGNTFTVARSGDPYGLLPNEPHRDPNLPKEDVGSLLVVDAREQTSVALV